MKLTSQEAPSWQEHIICRSSAVVLAVLYKTTNVEEMNKFRSNKKLRLRRLQKCFAGRELSEVMLKVEGGGG